MDMQHLATPRRRSFTAISTYVSKRMVPDAVVLAIALTALAAAARPPAASMTRLLPLPPAGEGGDGPSHTPDPISNGDPA